MSTYQPDREVRRRLSRFGMLDRREADRSLNRLKRLGTQTPPRVWSAVFGVLWNKWATARRMQCTSSRCQLGCSTLEGEDSIEHYSRCPQVWAFARAKLHISPRFSSGIAYWTLAAPEDAETESSPTWWPRLALLLYSALKTTNAARHRAPLTPEEASRALQQAAMEGVRGHKMAELLTSR